jgi:cobalt-zinc-cadmium efflux system outer membrane protein
MALGLLPGTARAQTPTPPARLTVEQAVAQAVRRNPRLTAASREVAAARRGVGAARALANPSLTFTPDLTGSGGSDEELLFQQPLELNGTRSARTRIAQAQLRQTEAASAGELRELVFQTRNAYYELARAQELRTVAQDLLRTAEEFDRGVKRQAEEGLRPGIDQVQTGIEVVRARQQLTLAESEIQTAQAALNTLLAQPAATPIAVTTPIAFSPEPVNEEALLSQALTARTEIQAEAAQREEFRGEARLARAQGRPDLAPQLRAGRITRGLDDAGVGLGINLPIFDYGSRRNRVRQAEQSAQAQEARIEATRNQVRQEVAQALARLSAAETVVRTYQGGVLEQSRRLLEGSQRALQVGAPGASILNVLEAQRTYRSVQTEYTNALMQHAQAQAELDRAIGTIPANLPQVAGLNQQGGTR